MSESIRLGPDDGWTSRPPTMGRSPAQVFPLAHSCDPFCCCCCHSHQSGPRSQPCQVGALWHPGSPRHVVVCLTTWPVTHCLGCVPWGLTATYSVIWCLYCSHTCFIVHQTSLTSSIVKLLRIQGSNRRILNQTQGLPRAGRVEWLSGCLPVEWVWSPYYLSWRM